MFIKFTLSLLLCMSAIYSQYGWDDDDFRIPGSVLTGSAIIEQLADDEGLEIYGFDDMSSVFIKLYIDGANLSTAEASNTWLINAPNNINIVSNSENVYVKLGDAGGVKAFIVEDSGGNDMASIDSDGNAYFAGYVGIGTTTPLGRLEIGEDNNGATLRLSTGKLPDNPEDIGTLNKIQFVYRKNRSGGASPRLGGYIASRSKGAFFYSTADHDSALDFATTSDNVESVKMTIDNTGNVGIGISIPLGTLHIVKDGDANIRLQGNATGNPYFSFLQGSTTKAVLGYVDNGASTDYFEIRSDGHIYLNPTGNVGIGEVVPGSKLDINGSIDFNSVAVGAETAIETVVDLQDLQGAVIDGQVPNNITLSSINATTESAIETVVDLQDLQGAVINTQLPTAISRTTLYASNWVHSVNPFWSGGQQGVTTTFTNGDGNIVTVTGGIITDISAP